MLGADWRTFRKAFIEHGGDGLYGVWTPVHLEPVFQNLEDRAPNYDPRYKGQVKSYNEGDCPNVEAFRRRICLFKTGMQTLDKVRAQVDALGATIRYFAGSNSIASPTA